MSCLGDTLESFFFFHLKLFLCLAGGNNITVAKVILKGKSALDLLGCLSYCSSHSILSRIEAGDGSLEMSLGEKGIGSGLG